MRAAALVSQCPRIVKLEMSRIVAPAGGDAAVVVDARAELEG
jgi:hypothetical protein